MAEKIQKSVDESAETIAEGGRPEHLGDIPLRINRDQILALLQLTWYDVAWPLQNVKMPSDVIQAVSVWKAEAIRTVQLLLLPTESRSAVTSADIVRMDKEKVLLWKSIQIEGEKQNRLQASLWQANEAYITPDSNVDPESLLEQRSEILAALNEVELNKLSLRRKVALLQKRLDEESAVFARHQVAEFCGDKRYEMRPENLANALAGLPFMTCRTSINRCSQWKLEDLGGGQFNIVNFIRGIIRSCPKHSSLVEWARKALNEADQTAAVNELNRNWLYLSRSLAATPFSSPDEMSFLVAREYRRLYDSRNSADMFVEQNVRLK